MLLPARAALLLALCLAAAGDGHHPRHAAAPGHAPRHAPPWVRNGGPSEPGDPLELGLPNVILVGAQKCGTTNFKQVLDGHPSVEVTKANETRFFDKAWNQKQEEKGKGVGGWRPMMRGLYRSFWDGAATPATWRRCGKWGSGGGGKCRVRFEKTPVYLFHISVPYRMAELYGPRYLRGLQVVAFLRDPAARALSHMQMVVRQQRRSEGRAGDLFEERATALIRLRKLARVLRGCPNAGPRLWAGPGAGGLRCPEVRAQQAQEMRAKSCFGGAAPFKAVVHHGMYVDGLARYLCAGFKPHQIALVPHSALWALPPSNYGNLVRAVAARRRLPLQPSNGSQGVGVLGPQHGGGGGRGGAPGGGGGGGHASRSTYGAKLKPGKQFHNSEAIPGDVRRELDALYGPHNKRLSQLLAWAKERGGFMQPLGPLDPFKF